jgi:hypothetical protein
VGRIEGKSVGFLEQNPSRFVKEALRKVRRGFRLAIAQTGELSGGSCYATA